MVKVLPLIEAYALMNIATQNITGGSPLQTLLGDLNASGGTGYGAALMGPQPGVITIKEMLTGTMNAMESTQAQTQAWMAGGFTGRAETTLVTSATSPLDALSQNFQNNFGNIIVGSVLTTAGFRIANKVLAKPKNKFNGMIRQMGLGSTVQL